MEENGVRKCVCVCTVCEGLGDWNLENNVPDLNLPSGCFTNNNLFFNKNVTYRPRLTKELQ